MKKIIYCLLLIFLIFICDTAFCVDPIIHFATETYKSVAKIPKNKIIVYPNPWIPESGISAVPDDPNRKNTLKHGHLSAEGWIKFAGMQKDTGTLKIYDVTGNLVKNFRWDATREFDNFLVAQFEFSYLKDTVMNYFETQEFSDTYKKDDEGHVIIENDKKVQNIKIIHWDGRDNNNEYVKSGVYIWILSEDGGYTHHGKIAIVR